MNRDTFESMVNDYLADHACEFENDPLIINGIEYDECLGYVCYAEDSKTNYILVNDGNENIIIHYGGTR